MSYECHTDQPNPESGDWQSSIDSLHEHYHRKETSLTQDEWRIQVQDEIIKNIGQVRSADRLQVGLKKMDDLEKAFDEIGVGGETVRQRCDNLRKLYETKKIIQVARMLGTAALHRNESRGGHYRLDFPDQDDKNFLANIVLTAENGTVKFELRPVPSLTDTAPPPPDVISTEAQLG